MNYYEFLLQEKAAGRFKIWMRMGAPSQLPTWMEIYQYHLDNPSLSQLALAHDCKVGHSTVQRALAFMNQPVT